MLKAVIVGINDYAAAPLAGCVNDAEDVIAYLSRRGALAENIVPIYDGRASKNEIVAALDSLIASGSSGDHLFFHYSGHGSQIPSTSAEEADAFDECLCPVDFTWDDPATALRDKDLAALLAQVPRDVTMTVVLDSCHSGDMRRNPTLLYAPAARWQRRSYPMPLDLQRRLLVARKRALRPPVRILAANIVVVSACQSYETAADTAFGGRANGAFTYYWYDAVDTLDKAPLTALIAKCSKPLESYAMHPMLDGSADVLQQREFLVDPPPIEGGTSPSIPRTMTLVFDETYEVKDLELAVEVRLASSGKGEFRFEVTRRGGTATQWSFPIASDASYDLELDREAKLVFAVRRWTVTGITASFDLSLRVVAPRVELVVVEKSVPPRVPSRKVNGGSRDVDSDGARVL